MNLCYIGFTSHGLHGLSALAVEWLTTTTVLHDLRDAEDGPAWNRFATRFRTPIIAFGLRMGLRAPDSEDLAQETLLAFVKRFREGAYDPQKGRLHDWLFGIAYRQMLKLRERATRAEKQAPSGNTVESFWSQVPSESEATKSWNEEWARAVLAECLERVRAEFETKTVRAFEMFALAKQPADQVASELGLSRNAVFIAKHRILKRIRELQEGYERLS